MSLEDLKRLAAARTKGEWFYSTCYGVATIENADRDAIAHAVSYIKTEDAPFIVAMANNIDKLLAVVEAAKDLHARLQPMRLDGRLDAALAALEEGE